MPPNSAMQRVCPCVVTIVMASLASLFDQGTPRGLISALRSEQSPYFYCMPRAAQRTPLITHMFVLRTAVQDSRCSLLWFSTMELRLIDEKPRFDSRVAGGIVEKWRTLNLHSLK